MTNAQIRYTDSLVAFIDTLQPFARKVIALEGSATSQRNTLRSIVDEIRAMSKLCQPGGCLNLVTMLRQGQTIDGASYYIDMELCEGSLRDLMDTHDSVPIKLQQIWGIMVQITNGLSYIHSHGEVHRDMKPQNSRYQ
jgi:serine/threonine protein kinase